MRSAWVVSVCVCLSTFLAGCGSNSGASCANAAPCGGKVVGTWKVASACEVTTPGVMADCAGATSSLSSISATGTVTFNGDLTYSSKFVVSSSATWLFPSACLPPGGVTCEQLTGLINANSALDITARCTATAAGDCTCDITQNQVTTTQSGTYSTNAAGLLIESPTGGTSTLSDYCVRGSTLTLSPHTDSRIMSSVMGTITLSK